MDGAGFPLTRRARVPNIGLATSMSTALTQWWLCGARAVFGWNSPGLGEGTVTLIPPNHGPDCHCYCSRCPEKALLATYERRCQLAIARLALSLVSTSEPVGMKSPLLTEAFSTAA